jgi:adenine-specific DNA-methyltransferase
MARGIRAGKSELRLLVPAAGGGILICAVAEELVARGNVREIEIVAHEIDADLVDCLEKVLRFLKNWAANLGVRVSFEIRKGDFVLSECVSLPMLEIVGNAQRFDLVIGNPPYFKIGKQDARATAASEVVYGQPNIYGIFMAVSAALLRVGGELVFITPRSFASGPYFKRFREWFFARVRPLGIHVFGSRRDAFGRDEVLQENVIFHGVRDDGWEKSKRGEMVAVSTSQGVSDLDRPKVTERRTDELIAGEGKILRIPASRDEEQALRKVEAWTGSLEAYGIQISTGPVVAFRSTGWLRKEANGETVPLVWLNHVFPLEMHWPNGVRKPQYISAEAASEKLLLPCKNYVVMRRFSA